MAEHATNLKNDTYDTAWTVIYDWWVKLQNNSGNRANMKRARSVNMVATQFSYLDLYNKMLNSDIPDSVRKKLNYNLPLVAGVISHIKNNDSGRSVAVVMGSSTKAGSDRKLVSDLRFRRLMRTEDTEELYIMMVRMIRMMDGKVNVKDLAQSLYFWNEKTSRTRKKWASQYYLKKDIYSKTKDLEKENIKEGE